MRSLLRRVCAPFFAGETCDQRAARLRADERQRAIALYNSRCLPHLRIQYTYGANVRLTFTERTQ